MTGKNIVSGSTFTGRQQNQYRDTRDRTREFFKDECQFFFNT